MPITIMCTALRDVEMEAVSPLASDEASMSSTGGSSPPTSLLLSPASPQDQSCLLRSPPEVCASLCLLQTTVLFRAWTDQGQIIHRVLAFSDNAACVAPAASSCKALRTFIYENPDQALWRDLFLSRFDHPLQAGSRIEPRDVDWKREMQDREFTLRVFREWTDDMYHKLVRRQIAPKAGQRGVRAQADRW